MDADTSCGLRVPVDALPKIPKKPRVVLPLYDRFSSKCQLEYMQIYDGLSVLILGDASMRVLYMDLCRMLSTGSCLSAGDAALQRGKESSMAGKSFSLIHVCCLGHVNEQRMLDHWFWDASR